MEKKKKPQQGQIRASWTPVPQTPAATPSSQSVQANHSLEDLPLLIQWGAWGSGTRA